MTIPKVTPGQEIVFSLDDNVDPDDYGMGGIFILYNFYDEDPDNEPKYTTTMMDLYAWMGYLEGEGSKPSTPYEVGQISSTGTEYKVTVPADANGYRWFYARLAGINEDNELEYSDVVTSMYNVEGEAPVVTKPDMPTFNPVSGTQVDPGTKVAISAAADVDMIWYVVDGEDADLTMTGNHEDYEKPITILKEQTIKAVAVKGVQPPFVISDVATATYTVTDKERTDVPKLTVTPAGTIEVDGSTIFSCTLNPQEYTHTSGKMGFIISFKNGAGIERLEYQVGAEVNPEGWIAYRAQDSASLKRGTALAAIPDINNNASTGRVITIADTTVHYRLTLSESAETESEVVFQAVEVNVVGSIVSVPSNPTVLAEASVKFKNAPKEVKPIKPDQTDIKFTPYPKDDLPENIAKGGDESVYLRPVDPEDTVYYRILSVAGADQTSPINRNDVKVVTRNFYAVEDYVPIRLTEDLVNANGQFVVKAATLRKDGTWSTNVIAAYNVVFGEHTSFDTLAFVSEVPTQFMVGESYEMKLRMKATEESLERYGNTNVSLVINWAPGTGIDLANVEYKFAESEDWTALDKDDLDDIIRIPNTFRNFHEKDVWVKLTMSRKKRSDEIEMGLSIVRGNSFMDAVVLSTVIYKTVPCVGRPATDPVFNPVAGYIAKGSTVTMTTTPATAKIYYTTDGTEPSASSTEYTAPVVINSLTTIKAIAVTDEGTSFVSEAVYSVVPVPVITPKSGRVVYDSLVEITFGEGVSAEGVDIYYTTDGTEPSATNGTKYTEPFPLQVTVVKAIAVKDGDMSAVITREYTLIPAIPTATPKAGTVAYGTKVKLECATPDVEMYWRIGGGYTPLSKNDNPYTEEIEIKETCQLKVIAYLGDATVQTSFSYTVTLVAPEFSIPEGIVEAGARVELSSKSIEANTSRDKQINISYTTDGTEPDKNSTKYTGPIEITETVTIKAVTWAVGTRGTEMSEVSSATYTVKGDDPVVE
ncbi:MAG: chitobiase/beta-hexosaminidase C-terminal domain-containing protein, partial [Bacteroidales bacterium]|nr:chitobiase/beta-hexosaminidase C-terminal domain-containing protein [Bacteroidales bacterium]